MSKMSEAAARRWDTYWSEAERAGLKAMGKSVRYYWERSMSERGYALIFAIRDYVQAARKVKEGK